jgi:NAD(P)-dependent dehydrogenase (short-subunit alcohol dehydrogenase family)
MIEAGAGAFINIVSATGRHPVPGFDAYGLAKGGLILLTRYMAREWGRHGIRANAVSPGLITNPHAVATGDSVTKATGLLDRTALGRKGHKEEVVGAVVFLASDAASFISGEVIAVNGGRF